MTKIVKSLHKTNSSPKVLETKVLKYLSVSLKLPIKRGALDPGNNIGSGFPLTR